MKRLLIILIIFPFTVWQCKDKDNDPKMPSESPTTTLNGWSFRGKDGIMVNSADDSYQLFLARCFEHPEGYTDVFYGVKYKMLNYFGSGNGVYINSTRWLINDKSQTARHIDNSDEFTTENGFVYTPVYIESLGEVYVTDWVKCINVEVLGTGNKEFKIYHPDIVLDKTRNFLNDQKEGQTGQFNFSTGSRSPLSILSSPVCHIKGLNKLVQTNEYWSAYNLAIGSNTSSGQSFIVSYSWDSMLIKIAAVTAHDVFEPDKGVMRGAQPMKAKKIDQIIPQWNRNLPLEFTPSYFQYSNKPDELFMILQNKEQLFVVSFNMTTFKFKLIDAYLQPRSTELFDKFIHSFQWIDEEEGCFMFTEKTGNGVKIKIHRAGKTSEILLPEFNATVVKGVMDVLYDGGKLWLMTADNDKKIYLYNKSYR